MAQLMPLPLTVSCFSKIQIGSTFWYWLTWVVLDKGPINWCVCGRCQVSENHVSDVGLRTVPDEQVLGATVFQLRPILDVPRFADVGNFPRKVLELAVEGVDQRPGGHDDKVQRKDDTHYHVHFVFAHHLHSNAVVDVSYSAPGSLLLPGDSDSVRV